MAIRKPPCPPNCERRRPACQGHCETYAPYAAQVEKDRELRSQFYTDHSNWTDAQLRAISRARKYKEKNGGRRSDGAV